MLIRTFDFAPLYRPTVGFDRIFSMLDRTSSTARKARLRAIRPTVSSGAARTPNASRSQSPDSLMPISRSRRRRTGCRSAAGSRPTTRRRPATCSTRALARGPSKLPTCGPCRGQGRELGERAPTGAYWLLDEIALAQRYEKSVAGEEFQLWKLKVNPDHTATLTCEDGNGKTVYGKAIEYTDFPLPEIALYFTNSVILLPSEY
jgi:hypothetical protein